VSDAEVAVTIVSLSILSGVGLMIAAMMNRRRFRELEHRERLAMIEHRLLPSPESDPAGFELGARLPAAERESGVRFRTAGVMMIGLGLGLLVLLTFTAGAPGVGLGVGGGWAILGAASLFNYFLISRREQDGAAGRRWTPPSVGRHPEPPAPGSL
jgi:hypothetical protein